MSADAVLVGGLERLRHLAGRSIAAGTGSYRSVTGTVLGTPGYMSPEQARGGAVDQRTDIWAFGCLLYELVTGHRAFESVAMSDAVAAVLEHEPDWPS